MARILLDAFFHQPPGHRIGDQIVVGGYAVNFGRYTPGDCFHPNGLAMLHADLAPEHELVLLRGPYSDASLYDADVLLITNPDYPLYEQASPYRWTPKDVDALLRFLERGGGVLLMVNSFLSRPDYWEENFDYERVSLLFDKLGVRWDPNYMSNDDVIEPAQSGDLCVGYGQGGRVWNAELPPTCEPLLTFEGNIYGFKTRVGAGTLVVLGDTGMISNGLICFPGFENAAFFNGLFTELVPAWSAGASHWDYLRYGHLSVAPSTTGLSEEIMKALRPGAEWMEDHHYRHLTWHADAQQGAGDAIWAAAPVDVAGLALSGTAVAPLRWLSLDGQQDGPEVGLPLTVETARRRDGIDLHAIGRVQTAELSWGDLCRAPELFAPAGLVQQTHLVFELHAVLDADGRPQRARWAQGQFVYARNPNSLHYGWEVLLTSDNGIIAPRTVAA
ncbi:MAG: hypothetical protein ACYDCO_00015 [Armatimonadota bacterium]